MAVFIADIRGRAGRGKKGSRRRRRQGTSFLLHAVCFPGIILRRFF